MVRLKDKEGEICRVERQWEGGEYILDGNTGAELYITYNYSKFYYSVLDRKKGLEFLNEKKSKSVIEKIRKAVGKLGTKRNKNYWRSTRGNAGYALSILMKWAEQYPEAIFEAH